MGYASVMETMAISKFKAQCLAVLERVRKGGKPILITRFGKPIAEVSPPPAPRKNGEWMGSLKHTCTYMGDIVSPLDPEDWGSLAP